MITGNDMIFYLKDAAVSAWFASAYLALVAYIDIKAKKEWQEGKEWREGKI